MFDKTKLKEWVGMLIANKTTAVAKPHFVETETEESLRAKGYVPLVPEEYRIENGLRCLHIYGKGSTGASICVDGVEWTKCYSFSVIREPVLSIVEDIISNHRNWVVSREQKVPYGNWFWRMCDKRNGVKLTAIETEHRAWHLTHDSAFTKEEMKWAIEKLADFYYARSSKAKALRAKRSREKLIRLYVKGGE